MPSAIHGERDNTLLNVTAVAGQHRRRHGCVLAVTGTAKLCRSPTQAERGAAASSRRRSASLSCMVAAATFSAIRSRRRVPGIGTMSGPSRAPRRRGRRRGLHAAHPVRDSWPRQHPRARLRRPRRGAARRIDGLRAGPGRPGSSAAARAQAPSHRDHSGPRPSSQPSRAGLAAASAEDLRIELNTGRAGADPWARLCDAVPRRSRPS